ncbi:MAG: hypothetical protein Q4P05_03880 [Actinomycetaceae bacterium]|nr:hypothetical protein [Actinomycetaceae bacterium]
MGHPDARDSDDVRWIERAVISGLVVLLCALGGVGAYIAFQDRAGEEPDIQSLQQNDSLDSTGATANSPTDNARVEAADAMKDVDLGNRRWVFRLRDEEFTLDFVDGEYTSDSRSTWSLKSAATVYSDANGDGYVDAATIVEKQAIGATNWEQFVVLWRWDPQAGDAVIIPDVIGYVARCYGSVNQLQAIPGGFRMSGVVVPRDSVDSSCVAPRGETYARSVGIVDEDPVRIDETGGWGGVCGHGIGEASVAQKTGDIFSQFKVAPRPDAEDITLKLDHFGEANGHPVKGDSFRYERNGYVLMYYLPHDMDFERLAETPCGWAKLK